ncbi:MAG: caspase family protein [Nostoc sp.]|uniref:caspase family protein n=1 Tax=Nostoc sp. TaxID=1180 RepID=UPI002FF4E7DE
MGRNWAIVVGINHYENLRSLNFAKRDASVMATWFQQEAKFNQVFLFTDDSPAIAANSPIPTQPTFGHVRRFLRAQFENIQSPLLKPEDNLWFFFAGHGNRYKDKDYLMFSDSDPGDVENTAISVDYVTQRLRRSGADNVVLFLDACRDESSRAGLGIGEQSYQGVITFYSCTANQKSWEIEELQHGSFTHSLLEGLRLQGEANCATVERLAQYLCYQVPHLNTRYGKPAQNPYLQAEPPYKMYFILLEQTATLRDVEPLKYQASIAGNRGDFSLAKQLWVRVLAVSRGDLDAIDAIERIALRRRASFEPTISTSEAVTSSSRGRSASAESTKPTSLRVYEFSDGLIPVRNRQGEWVSGGFACNFSNINHVIPKKIQIAINNQYFLLNNNYPPKENEVALIGFNLEEYHVIVIATGLRDDVSRPLVARRYFWLENSDKDIDGVGSLLIWWFASGQPQFKCDPTIKSSLDYMVTAYNKKYFHQYYLPIAKLFSKTTSLPLIVDSEKIRGQPHYSVMELHCLALHLQYQFEYPLSWAWNVRSSENPKSFLVIYCADEDATRRITRYL